MASSDIMQQNCPESRTFRKDGIPDYSSCEILVALAKKCDIMIFGYDISLQCFTYHNPAFTSTVRAENSKLDLKAILSRVYPDDRDKFTMAYRRLLKTGQHSLEFRMDKNGQGDRWLRLNLHFIDEKKNVIAGYAEDITHIKAYAADLQAISERKNSVLNILAHDLTGPLGSIQNYASLMAREIDSTGSESLKEFAGAICRISKDSVGLVRDLIEEEFISSSANLLKKRVNIVESIRQVTARYQSSQVRLKQQMIFNCCEDHIFVDIDETKLLHAINNLLSNALKFTPKDGTVKVTVCKQADHVMIRVSDTGIGIPEKFHGNLFSKFSEAGRPGLNGEQSIGLGMSIIKTIVDWHKGRILVRSKENKGTTISILLPYSD
ncbi:hypothetical protein GS399_19880 [Pedobacter sp. HMF7647]|uniref:histidine kinase n=1 Tax=Hufsiella arboris TaxID=2695275 RepID=A0A7K1YF78_9SPHI|nr:PAS domain-containing sensor histidine kinase [Hufsiella arboris]MXV53232.1 hypothetical protein [Hufsiella arboris]